VHLACQLKKEVPNRSISKIIRIMDEMGMAPKGLVRRSTLHWHEIHPEGTFLV
jgi:hypothetical protein